MTHSPLRRRVRHSLAWRLAGWFLILSMVPIAVMAVAVPRIHPATVAEAEGSLLLTVGGVLVVVALLTGVATWVLVSPIQRLTQAARCIGAGDLDVHIDTEGLEGELAVLGDAFNDMADRLRAYHADLEDKVARRTRDLATLNAVAVAVSRTLDPEHTMRVALSEVVAPFGFEAGAVFLGDGSSGPATAQGFDSSLLPEAACKVLATRAVAEGRPVAVKEAGQEGLPEAEPFRALVCIPLRSTSGSEGVMLLASRTARPLTDREIVVLGAIGRQVGAALHAARLFGSEQRRAEQLAVISEVGRHVTTVMYTEDLLWEIRRLASKLLGYSVGVGLIEGDEVVYRAGAGQTEEEARKRPKRYRVGDEGISGRVASTGVGVRVGDVGVEPSYRLDPDYPNTRSELVVPLRTKDAVIGVLDVQSSKVNAFDESDEIVLTSLANQAAIAVENLRLYERTKKLAVIEERQRLARELHDAVTQSLYGVTLYAEAASRLLSAGDVEGAAADLRQLQETAQDALREMRLLIFELRPPMLDEVGLVGALRARLEAVEGRAGVHTMLVSDDHLELPPDVEQGLYRIAQEALNNALKHSRANTISVTLRMDGDDVVLRITDDGVGFDPEEADSQGGFGVTGMKERAELLGGQFELAASPGGGTDIRVTVGLRND
ncbi:MAG: GAF domain-containing protein [Anaerolineae bacterium]